MFAVARQRLDTGAGFAAEGRTSPAGYSGGAALTNAAK